MGWLRSAHGSAGRYVDRSAETLRSFFEPTRARMRSPSRRSCCRSRCTPPCRRWRGPTLTVRHLLASRSSASPSAPCWSAFPRPRWARPFRSPAHVLGARSSAARPLYAANTAGAAVGRYRRRILADSSARACERRRGSAWRSTRRAPAAPFWIASTISPVASKSSPRAAERRAERSAGSRIAASSNADSARSRAPRSHLACRGSAADSRPPPPPSLASAALVYEVVWTRLLALVDRAHDLRVRDDGGVVHQRARDRVGDRRASARANRRPAAVARRVAAIAGGSRRSVPAWYAATAHAADGCGAGGGSATSSFDAVVRRQAFGVGLLLLPMTFALGASSRSRWRARRRRDQRRGARRPRASTRRTRSARLPARWPAGSCLCRCSACATSIRARRVAWRRCGGAACWAAGLRGAKPPVDRAWTRRIAAAPRSRSLLLAFMPPWDRALLASGAYKYAPYHR